MGGMEQGKEVFDAFWPEARAVSDDTLRFYHGFKLKRGSPAEMFGPRNLLRAFAAMRKGYRQGKTGPDPWLMPGAFLVRGREIVWSHKYRFAGDEPDYGSMPRP